MWNQSLQLPVPDPEWQAHSNRLLASIKTEISEKGPITFARYMETALYTPGLGYYKNNKIKFGAQGDFITAPELSPLFSRCVARQCRQVLTDLPGSDILEIGAGSGVMARIILQSLAAQNALPEHYYILEISSHLQQLQREEFSQHAPELLSKVIWLARLPPRFNGVILANEVLDALPVHRFGCWNGLQEYYVTCKNGELSWELGPLHSENMKHSLESLEVAFKEGYTSEINMLLSSWIAGLDDILQTGVIFLFDYGMTRREYYHPDRSCGTFLCHYRHRAHANPFWWPGLQDITAQVDFTAVADAAAAGKLKPLAYTHQAAFLLNCGITDFISGQEPPQERLELSRQIQKLTLPGEMGESFKVMALSKNYEQPLLGFKMMNQIERL